MSKNKYGGNYLNRCGYGKSFAKQDLNWKYSPKQVRLSISILVSGRMENMERCVASLEELRRKVPCELILTDTGCPSEQRDWLKQKADKVLRFTWCDDFAAARNVGLQAAVGEWFMFMDDDEWFEDTAGIEDFFLSGEYRRYQSASYIVRNYVNQEGTVWRDTHLTRMTKRRPDSRFFYPIHESLWPLLDPQKNLEDYAHHYGYAYVDQEAAMAKRRRNLRILLPAIEEDPHCMKHYLQAVAEYYSMDDYESAYKIADRGIANCEPDRQENVPHIDGLYGAAVRMRLRGGQSIEAARIGRDYLENASMSDLARASISGDLVIAYGELGESGLSRQYLQEYLKWKGFFARNKEAWLKQETVVLDSCFENFQYRRVCGWGLAAALSLKDGEGAEALLAGEPLEWWMDAVRGWYTLASEEKRERWQRDFQELAEGLGAEEASEERSLCLRTDIWDGRKGSYAHVMQLYKILTMPEPESGQENRKESEVGHGVQDRQKSESVQKGRIMPSPGSAQEDQAASEPESGREHQTASDSGSVQEGQATPYPRSAQNEAQEPRAEGERPDSEEMRAEAEQGKGRGNSAQREAEQPAEGRSEEADGAAREMEALAALLKEKVRAMIGQGQLQAALDTIRQLQGYFPEDKELEELQAECQERA